MEPGEGAAWCGRASHGAILRAEWVEEGLSYDCMCFRAHAD